MKNEKISKKPYYLLLGVKVFLATFILSMICYYLKIDIYYGGIGGVVVMMSYLSKKYTNTSKI